MESPSNLKKEEENKAYISKLSAVLGTAKNLIKQRLEKVEELSF